MSTNLFQSLRGKIHEYRISLELPNISLEFCSFFWFLRSIEKIIDCIIQDEYFPTSDDENLEMLHLIQDCLINIQPHQVLALCDQPAFEKANVLNLINNSIEKVRASYTSITDLESFVVSLRELGDLVSSKIHSVITNISVHLSEIKFLIEMSNGITAECSSSTSAFHTNFYTNVVETGGYILISKEHYPPVVIDNVSENCKASIGSFNDITDLERSVSIIDETGLPSHAPVLVDKQNLQENYLNLLMSAQRNNSISPDSLVDNLKFITTVIFSINKCGNMEHFMNLDAHHKKILKCVENFISFIRRIPLSALFNPTKRNLLLECLCDLHFATKLVVSKTPSSSLHDALQIFHLTNLQLINLSKRQDSPNKRALYGIIEKQVLKRRPLQPNRITKDCLPAWRKKFTTAKNMMDILSDSPNEECLICYNVLNETLISKSDDLAILPSCRHVVCHRCFEKSIVNKESR